MAGVFPIYGLILAHFSLIEKEKILLNQVVYFGSLGILCYYGQKTVWV